MTTGRGSGKDTNSRAPQYEVPPYPHPSISAQAEAWLYSMHPGWKDNYISENNFSVGDALALTLNWSDSPHDIAWEKITRYWDILQELLELEALWEDEDSPEWDTPTTPTTTEESTVSSSLPKTPTPSPALGEDVKEQAKEWMASPSMNIGSVAHSLARALLDANPEKSWKTLQDQLAFAEYQEEFNRRLPRRIC